MGGEYFTKIDLVALYTLLEIEFDATIIAES